MAACPPPSCRYLSPDAQATCRWFCTTLFDCNSSLSPLPRLPAHPRAMRCQWSSPWHPERLSHLLLHRRDDRLLRRASSPTVVALECVHRLPPPPFLHQLLCLASAHAHTCIGVPKVAACRLFLLLMLVLESLASVLLTPIHCQVRGIQSNARLVVTTAMSSLEGFQPEARPLLVPPLHTALRWRRAAAGFPSGVTTVRAWRSCCCTRLKA